jgi:hypothetical protein
MDMKLDMTQIQDGFPSDEHAFSAVPIADDIVQLFAKTGVSYTPTLQISNGGLWGQSYFFSGESSYFDQKLRHFTPHFVLAKKMERLHSGLLQEYSFPAVAEGAARIQRAGGLVGVGSHGELPGLGRGALGRNHGIGKSYRTGWRVREPHAWQVRRPDRAGQGPDARHPQYAFNQLCDEEWEAL